MNYDAWKWMLYFLFIQFTCCLESLPNTCLRYTPLGISQDMFLFFALHPLPLQLFSPLQSEHMWGAFCILIVLVTLNHLVHGFICWVCLAIIWKTVTCLRKFHCQTTLMVWFVTVMGDKPTNCSTQSPIVQNVLFCMDMLGKHECASLLWSSTTQRRQLTCAAPASSTKITVHTCNCVPALLRDNTFSEKDHVSNALFISLWLQS